MDWSRARAILLSILRTTAVAAMCFAAVAWGVPRLVRLGRARAHVAGPSRAAPPAHPVVPGEPTNEHRGGFTPSATDGAGSTVALARLGERRVALVADADESSVLLVDLDARALLSRTPLAGTPAQLLVTREGRLFVALRDRARVAVLEPAGTGGRLVESGSLATDDEPFALAETRDGSLLVTCALAHSLDVFGLADLARRFAVNLPREPRAVYPSSRHARAYVAHLGAPLLSVVDLSSPEHRVSRFEDPSPTGTGDPHNRAHEVQGYALTGFEGTIYAPHAQATTGDLEHRVSTRVSRSGGGGYGGSVTVTSVTRTTSVAGANVFPFTSSVSDDALPQTCVTWAADCSLPRAAVAVGRDRYLAACAGEGAVAMVDGPRGGQRWEVGQGLTGIAVDLGEGQVVAWAQYDRVLGAWSIAPGMHADGPPLLIPLPRTGPALDATLERGRFLFNETRDRRISADGRACATCHPDGLDDGLTWATPDGPRQTPTLRGRVEGTAPYGWTGKRPTLAAHLELTIQRLGGRGLPRRDSDALVAYVLSMNAPPRSPPADDVEASRVRRGADIFDERCAGCHDPAHGFADARRHDVGSRAKADLTKAFDTPSLRFVGSTAPYFHDGRYASLLELLEYSEGEMWIGPAGGMPQEDLLSIDAYLRTL